jgi:hypothetical protein
MILCQCEKVRIRVLDSCAFLGACQDLKTVSSLLDCQALTTSVRLGMLFYHNRDIFNTVAVKLTHRRHCSRLLNVLFTFSLLLLSW